MVKFMRRAMGHFMMLIENGMHLINIHAFLDISRIMSLKSQSKLHLCSVHLLHIVDLVFNNIDRKQNLIANLQLHNFIVMVFQQPNC